MIDLQQAGQGREGYELLAAQLEALLADERDFVANAAQFSAFLFHELGDLNWAGFYLNKGEQLVLGPFQGKVACVRIPFGRGVCGAAASSRQTQRVEDVHAFRGISPVTAHQTASWWCRWSGRASDRRAGHGQPEHRALQSR